MRFSRIRRGACFTQGKSKAVWKKVSATFAADQAFPGDTVTQEFAAHADVTPVAEEEEEEEPADEAAKQKAAKKAAEEEAAKAAEEQRMKDAEAAAKQEAEAKAAAEAKAKPSEGKTDTKVDIKIG